MRLHKNIVRISAFVAVGAIAIAATLVAHQQDIQKAVAIAGSWADYTSVAWYDPADARYQDYATVPGSTQSEPFLIQTAEEFSGLREFERTEDLAGQYIRLAGPIDLSAHYWDPIELYGAGDDKQDMLDVVNDYVATPLPATDLEMVHFDGDAFTISGMTILDTYDKVPMLAQFHDRDSVLGSAGSSGLFSYTYRANITNIRLDSPVVTLTTTSGVFSENDTNDDEYAVADIVGAAVGVLHNSRLTDIHIANPAIDYTATFGRNVEVGNGLIGYYTPEAIFVGGASGYAYIYSLLANDSTRDGYVNVAPIFDESTDDNYLGLSYSDVSAGGLVGRAYSSTILSTCSSIDVVFSDSESSIVYSEYHKMQSIFIGGLVGYISETDIMEHNAACVYNSCAHGDISVESLSYPSYINIGGIAGGVRNDSIINTYYDGTISASAGNWVGQIIGMLDNVPYDARVRSNFYLASSGSPVGYDDNGSIAPTDFVPITTVEQLVADLNAGRDMVIADAMWRSAVEPTPEATAKFASRVLTWSIRTGDSPLDCLGIVSAGIDFPDLSVRVPNTGGHI